MLNVLTFRTFDGNPLAVIMGARNLTTEQVQAIILEFKHPECILVLPPEGLRDIVVVPVSRAVISL
jgi:trans-2,3-dihydro-3-hydroxyanthranilate isomerase